MSIFLPDPCVSGHEAVKLDRRLMDSLLHMAQACGVAENVLDAIEGIGTALNQGGWLGPAHYGIHFELLDAIADGARDRVDALFALLTCLPLPNRQTITSCHPDVLPQAIIDIYFCNLDADGDRPLGLVPFDLRREEPARTDLRNASDLIVAANPVLAAEIGQVVREFVLVDSGPAAAQPFMAASTFYLWGGVFIAPQHHKGVLDLAETIVHEAAHNLLAGLTAEAPALLNDRETRFRSPLRSDPRPMEGVFHATFVLAREILFHRAVVRSSEIAEEHRSESAGMIERKTELFFDGLSVVNSQAELTPLGNSLIDDASKSVMNPENDQVV